MRLKKGLECHQAPLSSRLLCYTVGLLLSPFLADGSSLLLSPDGRAFPPLHDIPSHHHWFSNLSAKALALFRAWPYLLSHHDSKVHEERICPGLGQVLPRSNLPYPDGWSYTTEIWLSRAHSQKQSRQTPKKEAALALEPLLCSSHHRLTFIQC